jgi:hypothetical protein
LKTFFLLSHRIAPGFQAAGKSPIIVPSFFLKDIVLLLGPLLLLFFLGHLLLVVPHFPHERSVGRADSHPFAGLTHLYDLNAKIPFGVKPS